MFIFCLTAPSRNICCILTNFAYLSSTTAGAGAVAVAAVVVAVDPNVWLFPTELDVAVDDPDEPVPGGPFRKKASISTAENPKKILDQLN